jgi:phage terminase large subunit-like protein
VAWIEAHCRVPEGKDVGKAIILRPWQRRVIRGIYDTPTRQAIVSFGRKNGKTALAAMLVLLHLVGPEARQNSQLVSAAMSRDQAAKLFGLAAKMVRMSPDLSAYVTIRDSMKELFCRELGTLYEALSADADKNFGSSPALAIHDELGQVRGPRSELYEAIETGMGAHEGPLSIVISTQAPTDADLLSLLIDDAKSGKDSKRKLFMFSAGPDLDPFGVPAMRAANPAFGDFLNPVEVQDNAESARRMPSRESSYRNLHLNQRISQTSPLIPRAVWVACAAAPDDDVFLSGRVYIGLDLSARNDLTALVAVARGDDGAWNVRAEFFAPEVGVVDRAHRDRAPYDVWARDGILTLTPGASVDYAFVAERLCAWCDDHDVAEIAFDRWRIESLKTELRRMGREVPDPPFESDGMRLSPFGQGFKDMSPAIDSLESELLNLRLRHGGNPILTWCAANAIAVRDPAGNRKLDKMKSTGRIDGLVALTMAIGRATSAEGAIPERSFWETAAA